MSSRISMILAGLLLVGALIAGYWGLVLSRPEPATAVVTQPLASATAVAPAEDPTRQAVVVLVHDVPPFVALTAADLALEKLRTAPAGSLTTLEQAIGRVPWRSLEAGTWLTEQSFDAGGSLARMIRPNERALAVAVDEVTGAGGQFEPPATNVDVMLYLRQENGNPQPSAQTVIPALRLLGVGDQLGLTNDGIPRLPRGNHGAGQSQATTEPRQRTHGVARGSRAIDDSAGAGDPGRRIAPGRAQRRRTTLEPLLGGRQ